MRLLLLLLCAAAAFAEHAVFELECPDEVKYRVHRDLDGDGLDDILIVTGRQAWLWRGRKTKFQRAPDAKMTLPEGTAMFDVGPKGALVARTADGYFDITPGAQPARLARVSGPGLPTRPANVLWRGFFHDFDGDERGDFLDISLRGFAISYAGGDTVLLPPRLRETMDTHAGSVSGRLVARYALADWTYGDFNGDGLPDFAVLTEQGLLVYPGDERGRLDPARSLEVKIEEAKDADLTFQDLNGDGRTDVLAMRRFAGKSSILVAGKEGGLASPHRIRLQIPGEIRYGIVTDLDADGKPDLALPYTSKPSVQAGVRALVRGEAILKVPVFLNRGGTDCFGVRADAQFSFPVRLRITTDSAGRIRLSGLVVVEYGGDIDGDGRKDLLVTLSSTELGLHRGVKGEIFDKEVSQRLPIPDCGAFDTVRSAAANLNGDDRSDIILHYGGAGRRPDRLFVLLSR